MNVFYEACHPDRGYGPIWGKKEYRSLARAIASKWGKISIEVKNSCMEITILDKEGKGKDMPMDMHEYLLSREMAITEILKIKNLTLDKSERLQKEAMEIGKTIIPIGTDRRDGSSLIRYWDAPYQSP